MKTIIKICVLVFGILLLALGQVQAQTIWEANPLFFEKTDFADWTQQANQDRITNNVWLTRQDFEGLINFAQESSYDAFVSPADTEWAFFDLDGNPSDPVAITASNYSNLFFNIFEDALLIQVGNKILNRPAVLHLIQDDIYLNIEFDHWTKGTANNGDGGGGFSYTRASAPIVPEPISSTLFIIGGATLGFRGFWNKRNRA